MDKRALTFKFPSLDNTYGVYLLGSFIGVLLYGAMLYQAREYYRLYPKDRVVLKALVAVMMFLQTIFCAFNIHTCYYYLVTNYFSPGDLFLTVWSINLTPLTVAIIVVVAQSFFARRVYLVGRRYRPLAVFVVLLFVAELALDAVATARAFALKELTAATKQVTWLTTAGSIVASVADLLLTVVLIIALRQSRTGFKSTDSMISVISLYTINTGLVTGVFHVVLWILAIKYPLNLIYAFVGIVNTRLYGNVLLSTLNARIMFNQKGMNTFGAVTEFPEEGPMVFGGVRDPPEDSTVPTAPKEIIELRAWGPSQDNFGLRSSVDIASANVDIEIARDQDDSTRKDDHAVV